MSAPSSPSALTPAQSLTAALRHAEQDARPALCAYYLSTCEAAIRHRHDRGALGLEIAVARAAMVDDMLVSLLSAHPIPGIAIVATAAYGRSALNPRSETACICLLPDPETELSDSLSQAIQQLTQLLASLDLRLNLASFTLAECLELALSNPARQPHWLDARLVTGDAALFQQFQHRFASAFLTDRLPEFFAACRLDLRNRHQRHSRTVFLQEPNVKEGCGGLDDFHNIRWVCQAKRGNHDLRSLADDGILPASAPDEIAAAVDFLHHVRNALHYHTAAPTDQLTLMLQGVVSTGFRYPQRSILRRTEAFMRDYYRHTLNLYQYTTNLMEAFQIEQEQDGGSGPRSFLTFRTNPREEFDGFIAQDGRIHPASPDIFTQDPHRLMRVFQHCQRRDLRLSPQLSTLIKAHRDDIDRAFRCSRINRETFQAILERKGEVAHTLRQMHRVGFLGRYLPEFGALDCLVQHEFFHRYTADEHTLRCIDQLDALIEETHPRREIYRRLLHEIQDPYALYLAVILHDTGRAENVREHIDGSAMLASRLCNRLQIRGPRRSLIMFLVDNHLTFWRTATTRNLEDPDVIAEFAAIIKTRSNLDALFLFTFADSNGTSPDAWTGWKESLMLQLHSSTRRFLDGGGREAYDRYLDADRLALRDEVLCLMRDDYHPEVIAHFERMPAAAFHFRLAPQIVTQVRTIRHFLNRPATTDAPAPHCIKWIDHPERGYSELVLATHDRPLLLEKLCSALADCRINILSADFFTRTDAIVLDIFRVCTTGFEPVTDPALRASFIAKYEQLLASDTYTPGHLQHAANDIRPHSPHELTVPVQAYVTNHLHPVCTTIEIQALDRIGLLHDLFASINQHGLTTAHARICTEKGIAMDTLYITTPDGEKVTAPETLASLDHDLSRIIGCPETPH